MPANSRIAEGENEDSPEIFGILRIYGLARNEYFYMASGDARQALRSKLGVLTFRTLQHEMA